ncbi:MAG: FKBP-type peptidyl-prolyl cis-trans isomerase [Deltaproteobacteria bacterium]|jgi:hypothetical protein|nr:FKBP-type peptidyl-prolyl cis-trans isomerase [Deltaproteobacteria bacterium]
MKPTTVAIAVILAALSGALAVILYGKLTEMDSRADPETSAELPATEPAGDPPYVPGRERGFKDDFASLNAQREGVRALPSGVQYEIIESGDGRRPAATDTVVVRYEMTTGDGYIIDTTEDDGEPASMPLDEIVIPGLRDALLQMHEGDHWLVVIPPGQGFVKTLNNRLRRRDLIVDLRLLSIAPGATSEER